MLSFLKKFKKVKKAKGVYEKEDSLIAHIGSSVIGSIFVNGTYKAFPTLYNESVNEGIYVDDLKVNAPISALAETQTYVKDYRTAAKSTIYFAADFGAVADGSLIDKITSYDEYLENDEMARKRTVYTNTEADN